jgi:hypothetical protein
MTIPSKTIGSKSDVTLRCLARVIRTDTPSKGSQTGVACVIDSYEFVRPRSRPKSKARPKARATRKAAPKPKAKVRSKHKPRTK